MISRWLFVGLMVCLFLIAFVVTWISLTGASLSPAKQVLETCTPIHNAGPGKPSLVFFAPQKEAQQYANSSHNKYFRLQTVRLSEEI
jgi:hypothetical protein